MNVIDCFMVCDDTENIIFSTAANFISYSNYPVFLTGKAGTGKTTFLKHIQQHSKKNSVIVAPTGVAAINAGGTTIHSFFQLPFAPFIPISKGWGQGGALDKHGLLSKLRLSSERKELMQQLELLIIDEISMVRCDVLDAIDTVMRHVRNCPGKPFGGVQVLYIGDLYQLPPVVKETEWRFLQQCYENPYFFCSRAITENPPVYIELKKVYRQADEHFIRLLNNVRNNNMTRADLDLLHSRYFPGFSTPKEDNYITLTTHNSKADEINRIALAELPGKTSSFNAIVEGEFQEKWFPADEVLHVKAGAQVMFLKNDSEKNRRYYNGKIALVESVDEEKIRVSFKTGTETSYIDVKKETWRNIQYKIDKRSNSVEEKELGSFTQYPLKLAWAITIHKSQGLTFEKAIIDAGQAFAPGQVYVALSRCTSLEGIVLHSRITEKSLTSDEQIVRFCLQQQEKTDPEALLQKARVLYLQDTICQLFDFNETLALLDALHAFTKENEAFAKNTGDWFENTGLQLTRVSAHGNKFISVLQQMFSEGLLPESSDMINQRLVKAGCWFLDALSSIKKLILQSPAVTDNRQLSLDYDSRLKKLWDNISWKMHQLESIGETGFSMEKFRIHKASYKSAGPDIYSYSGKSVYAPATAHPELFIMLKDKRSELAREKNQPLFMVCGTLSLEQMANHLPQSLQQMEKISGFGKVKLKQYGNEFLQLILQYCEMNQIEPHEFVVPEKNGERKKPRNPKSDTRKLSFGLYKEGKTMQEIAKERNLSQSTIEGHMAFFIESGELAIDELVNTDTQQQVLRVIEKTGTVTLQKIKEQLPDISYSVLKWVMAYDKYRAGKN